MAGITLNRTIKYRAYPTAEQAALFAKTFGCVRYIWNNMLRDSVRFYEETDTHFIPTPAKYKKSATFLREVDCFALCNAQLDLEATYKAYFKKEAGFPNFKSKKTAKNRYTTNCQVNYNKAGTRRPTIYVGKDFVHLPKVGDVRIAKHRSPKNGWHLKSATVERTPSGKYYISVMYEFQEDVEAVTVQRAVGLDYSSPHFYVDSDGLCADPPHFYRETEERLAREQRKLSRMKPGSSNYRKQKQKVAAYNERVANQRKNFCHTLSAAIAKRYDAVFAEDIDLRALAGSLRLGKATNDNGFGMFRTMLEYKLSEAGKVFLKTEKFFASSQLCSNCGHQNPAVKELSVRTWTCPCCGAVHNRDSNAATNVLHRGLELLTSFGYKISPQLYRCNAGESPLILDPVGSLSGNH